MIKMIRWRLLAECVLLAMLLFLAAGWAGQQVLEQACFEYTKDHLLREARLLAVQTSIMGLNSGHDLTGVMERYKEYGDVRVMLVSPKGKVLADSEWPDNPMQYYADRSEIRGALKGKEGYAVRYSPSLHCPVIWAAVPVKQDGKPAGAVSISASLKVPQAAYNRLWLSLLGVFVLGALLAAGLRMRSLNNVYRPLSAITEVARAIADGDLKARAHYQHADDTGILASAINSIAANMEEKLNELSDIKRRLETVLSNTVNGIILISSGNQILYINPAACRLLGVAETDAMARPHLVFTSSYALTSGVDQVLKEHQPLKKEIVLHQYGNKTLATSLIPIMNGTSCEEVLVVLNDITELKRLETIRKDFVANVSHELKTPLSSISGFAETLMLENQDNKGVYDFASIIYDEASRLTRLVNGLLELTRIESENPNLQVQTFDIKECIRDTLERMKPKLQNKRIQVQVDSPEGKVSVEADRDRITQVLINLIDNAVNPSNEGDTVRIEVDRRPVDVYVAVIDQGPGIAPDEQPRVFERLYRVDRSRARKYGGYGLGLSIVRHIVEAHGGTVGVVSQPGHGALFYFTLPCR